MPTAPTSPSNRPDPDADETRLLHRRAFLAAAGLAAGGVAAAFAINAESQGSAPEDSGDRAEGQPDPGPLGSPASRGRPAELTPGADAGLRPINAQQEFLRLFSGGDGIVYGVRADGALLWFRHVDWRTGGPSWANGGNGRVIGSGFQHHRWVGASATGEIYTLDGHGTLSSMRYVLADFATGAGSWADKARPAVLATGWQRFPRVFGGVDSVLWAVDTGGDLYRAPVVSGRADAASVGTGYDAMAYLMADAGGQLYGVRENALTWQRYQGTVLKASDARVLTKSIWSQLLNIELFTSGDGVFYLIIPDSRHLPPKDNELTWVKLTQPASQPNTHPVKLKQSRTAVGLTVERQAALQGYASTPSVAPGQLARFAISSTVGRVQVSVVRCDAPQGLATVGPPASVSTQFQPLPADFRNTGCGWSDDVHVPIPASWPSGVYALQAESSAGLRCHLPFLVRNPKADAPLAVILPTNTYDAYNAWGGHNAYTYTPGGVRHLSRMRPADNLAVEPEGRYRAELYSDLLLLRWMAQRLLSYDVYADADLDAQPGVLHSYRGVVLGSHHEYWTDTAREALASYQKNGGRIVNTGGNALYERVYYEDSRRTIRFRSRHGKRDYFVRLGRPQSDLIGVNYDGCAIYTTAPYQVVSDHPLLAGTGLKPTDQFGTRGSNGAASGWETDRITGRRHSEAAGSQVIAVGTNTGHRGRKNRGAAMIMAPRPNGGFVFSASSITFNGSLHTDSATSRILENVFHAVLGTQVGAQA